MSTKKTEGNKRVAYAGLYDFDISDLLYKEADYAPEERVSAIAAYVLLLQTALLKPDSCFPLPAGRISDAARFLSLRLNIGARICEQAVRFLIAAGFVQKEGDRLVFPRLKEHGKTWAKSSLRVYRHRQRRKETGEKEIKEPPRKSGSLAPANPKPVPAAHIPQPASPSRRAEPAAQIQGNTIKKTPQSADRMPKPAPKVPAIPAGKPSQGANQTISKTADERKETNRASSPAAKVPPRSPARPQTGSKTQPSEALERRPRFTPMERPVRPVPNRPQRGTL